MHVGAPDRLIDPVRGEVLLRLVPFYLARLAQPLPADESGAARALGLPFPFLRDASPIDVTLRSGMTPADIGSAGGFEANSSLRNTSWWRWAAYARVPFGWVAFPTPFFTDGRLSHLSLQRHGTSDDDNLAVMDSWLVRELGEPASAQRTWAFTWGRVDLGFEPRDRAAEMVIAWDRS
jgi:hypothetical protein